MLIRLLTLSVAFILIFMVPWPIALIGMLGASLLVPVAGLGLGIVADLLYFTPGAAFMPLMTLYGAAISGAALLVHRFVKTRIITE